MPSHHHAPHLYETDGGISVSRITRDVEYAGAAQRLRAKLDTRRGAAPAYSTSRVMRETDMPPSVS